MSQSGHTAIYVSDAVLEKLMNAERTSLRKLTIWLVLLGLAGGGIILLATRVDEKAVWHHLVRDVGIATIVSALVTGIYEAYLRARVDIHKISSVLSTVAGSNVPPRVWQNIQAEILSRRMIRTRAELRLWISAANERYVIRQELSYDLGLLASIDDDLIVRHELDVQIDSPELSVPRFESVAIGNQFYAIPATEAARWQSADQIVKTAGEELTIRIRPADHIDTRICVRRAELRQAPGTYHLVMTELTDGLRVNLEDAPETLKLVLYLPNRTKHVLSKANPLVVTNTVILPGHTVELQLGG